MTEFIKNTMPEEGEEEEEEEDLDDPDPLED